jgi:CheY-like chemotaxis protein
VFELVRRTIGENITIETVLGDGVWHSEIDPNQLESALLNIAVNSRDAMPDGGKITIETTNTHFDDEYIVRMSDIGPGQYVLISISDTGRGMSADVLAKAFNPFFTTKAIGEGTGLGLSQVYGYVKQSGGHIKLHSEEGQGTTLKLYLPRLKQATMVQEPERAPLEYPGKAEETILVVEDDADVRAFSLDTLRDLGYSVLEARDAEVALRMLQLHPEVQLVFTDVGLPGMNGRELSEQVLALRPQMKVLFTSGYARQAIVHDGRLDPGVELLTKPFTRVQLADQVRRILDDVALPKTVGTALVVEDDSMVRMYVTEALSEFGFEVITAETSATAFAMIEEQSGIDVAVVDIGLPDGKGTVIGAELLHQWPFIKVVMISGDPSTFTGSLTRDRQVAFVAKPFNKEELRFALDRLAVKYRS